MGDWERTSPKTFSRKYKLDSSRFDEFLEKVTPTYDENKDVRRAEVKREKITLSFEDSATVDDIEKILRETDTLVETYRPSKKEKAKGILKKAGQALYTQEVWRDVRGDAKAARLYEMGGSFFRGVYSWPANLAFAGVLGMQGKAALAIATQLQGPMKGLGKFVATSMSKKIDEGKLKKYDLVARAAETGGMGLKVGLALVPPAYVFLNPVVDAITGFTEQSRYQIDSKRTTHQSLADGVYTQVNAQRAIQDGLAEIPGFFAGLGITSTLGPAGTVVCIGGGLAGFSVCNYLANRSIRWHNPSTQDFEEVTYKLIEGEPLPDLRSKSERAAKTVYSGVGKLFHRKSKNEREEKEKEKRDRKEARKRENALLLDNAEFELARTYVDLNPSLYSKFKASAKCAAAKISTKLPHLRTKDKAGMDKFRLESYTVACNSIDEFVNAGSKILEHGGYGKDEARSAVKTYVKKALEAGDECVFIHESIPGCRKGVGGNAGGSDSKRARAAVAFIGSPTKSVNLQDLSDAYIRVHAMNHVSKSKTATGAEKMNVDAGKTELKTTAESLLDDVYSVSEGWGSYVRMHFPNERIAKSMQKAGYNFEKLYSPAERADEAKGKLRQELGRIMPVKLETDASAISVGYFRESEEALRQRGLTVYGKITELRDSEVRELTDAALSKEITQSDYSGIVSAFKNYEKIYNALELSENPEDFASRIAKKVSSENVKSAFEYVPSLKLTAAGKQASRIKDGFKNGRKAAELLDETVNNYAGAVVSAKAVRAYAAKP